MSTNKLLVALGSLVLAAACSPVPNEEPAATTQPVLRPWFSPNTPSTAGDHTIASTTAPSLARRGTETSIYGTWNINLVRYTQINGLQWTDGENIGGGCGVPAAVGQSATHQDVFCNGTAGNNLWHQWFHDGAWGKWENLGGLLDRNSPVAASSWAPGRLDVFGLAGAHVWHAAWAGGNWAWEDLSDGLTFKLLGLAAVAPAPSKLDIFAVFTGDGDVYTRHWEGGWDPWTRLNHPPPSGLNSLTSARTNGLSAAVDPTGHTMVFAYNTLGDIYSRTQADRNHWSDWSIFDSGKSTSPNTLTAVARGDGIDLAAGKVISTDSYRILTSRWTP